VKFLVDHQLPPALAKFLREQGHDAIHVREWNLTTADDPIIWQRAVADKRAVVSKDEDFYYLAIAPSSTGQLVWVRIGNCRRLALTETFQKNLDQIVSALEAGIRVVEIR
jgi:predicted nuclease of predicted toxin-antitoxin system